MSTFWDDTGVHLAPLWSVLERLQIALESYPSILKSFWIAFVITLSFFMVFLGHKEEEGQHLELEMEAITLEMEKLKLQMKINGAWKADKVLINLSLIISLNDRKIF